jgi:hypothetical protein
LGGVVFVVLCPGRVLSVAHHTFLESRFVHPVVVPVCGVYCGTLSFSRRSGSVFSIVQSVRPGPSDGTGLPVSSPFIARTGRTIPVRPSWTSDGTKYNLRRPSNLWTGTDGGRLPRHRKNSDIFGTQRDLRYLNNEATVSRGSLTGAAFMCYRAPLIAAIQWGCLSVEAECMRGKI